jgi:hypothetical protein
MLKTSANLLCAGALLQSVESLKVTKSGSMVIILMVIMLKEGGQTVMGNSKHTENTEQGTNEAWVKRGLPGVGGGKACRGVCSNRVPAVVWLRLATQKREEMWGLEVTVILISTRHKGVKGH